MHAIAATSRCYPLVTFFALADAVTWGLVALTFVSLGRRPVSGSASCPC